ncbi:hypothetical protein ANO11243_055130 [Dothideomycetidae sp. 11243]|nr:hypothetical protein ANO11243_055130 [fungal sp. No.11243]
MKRYLSEAKQSDAPLIVNCPGWVVGSGADLIHSLVTDLRPSDVIILESSEMSTVDLKQLVQDASEAATVKVVPVTQPRPFFRPANEMRALQAMSYHHAHMSAEGAVSWPDTPLSAIKPWILDYSGDSEDFEGIISYHEALPLTNIALVLEYSPVAIVIIHDEQAFISAHEVKDEEPQQSPFTIQHSPEGIPYITPTNPSQSILAPLNPNHSACLGQAIITHIDSTRKELHLSTPVSQAEIHRALLPRPGSTFTPRLVLVHGKLPSVDWALLERAYTSGTYKPFIRAEEFDVSESESGDEEEDEDRKEEIAVQEDGGIPFVTIRNVGAAGEGGDDPSRAAGLLGQSVYRPRYLPRNAAR